MHSVGQRRRKPTPDVSHGNSDTKKQIDKIDSMGSGQFYSRCKFKASITWPLSHAAYGHCTQGCDAVLQRRGSAEQGRQERTAPRNPVDHAKSGSPFPAIAPNALIVSVPPSQGAGVARTASDQRPV